MRWRVDLHVRPFLLVLLAVLLATAASAGAADRLTVRTSLGPLKGASDDETRDLRARGKAPSRATVVVRFYRGSRRIATRRPTVARGRYSAATAIDRTGDYVVRVTATRPDGSTLRVTAKLTYGPTAEAPSAP